MLRFQRKTHLDFHLQNNFVLKGSLNCFQRNLFSHLFSKHCAVAVQLDTLCTTSGQLWCAKTMPHPIITNPPQRSCDRASPGLAVPIPHAFELKQLKTDTRPFCYTWSNRPPVLQFPKHCVEIAQMDSNGRHVLFHLQTSFFHRGTDPHCTCPQLSPSDLMLWARQPHSDDARFAFFLTAPLLFNYSSPTWWERDIKGPSSLHKKNGNLAVTSHRFRKGRVPLPCKKFRDAGHFGKDSSAIGCFTTHVFGSPETSQQG